MPLSVSELSQLKKQHDFAILAHFYQPAEIQDLADYVGDSYQLATHARTLKQKNIIMSGVVFMAESVKLLSPEKNVYVPDINAGCSLVNESPFDQYLQWRKNHPTAVALTYVNSSVAVKAISDVIVTSSNAAKIAQAIPKNRPILFGPDKNLGRYLAEQSKRDFILWEGSCQVHVLFSAKKLHLLIKEHPESLVIAHPECESAVLDYAQVIGSTSKLLETVQTHPAKSFIVATESGIFHQMKKLRPDAELIQAPSMIENCLCNDCPYMKLNTLEKIKNIILNRTNEITVPAHIQTKARIPLQRMVDIVEGRQVDFPEVFAWV
jgi:quinolinate synthase